MYKGLLHPPPDRDDAHYGRGASGRPGRVPIAAGRPHRSTFRPSPSRLAKRASPDTMATSVMAPLERQIAQIPGVSQMTSTSSSARRRSTGSVRPPPKHRRRRQRHPCGDQRRRGAAAEGFAEPADLSQGELGHAHPHPFRPIDVAPVIDVDDAAENILVPYPQSDLKRSFKSGVGGQRRTPAIRIQVDPAKRRKGLQLEDVLYADRHRDCQYAQGRAHRSEQTFTIQDNDQLTVPRPERRHHRLSELATSSACATSVSGRGTAGLDASGPAASRASFSSCS